MLDDIDLGNGAYVKWNGKAFIVYAKDGVSRVWLDLHAIDKLVRFAVSHGYQLPEISRATSNEPN